MTMANAKKLPHGKTLAGRRKDASVKKTKGITTPSSPGMLKIKQALSDHGPLTNAGLAKHTKITVSTVRGYMPLLQAVGAVHICGWERASNGGVAALFAIGPGENAPRPPVMTVAERNQRYRQNVKAKEQRIMAPVVHRPAPITFALIMGAA